MKLQLVGFVACWGHATARTWYVSAKASAGGDGSQGKPFNRISPAASSAQPGDTVLVSEGVYRERVAPANSGEEGKPITYMAAPGENVVITASEVLQWTFTEDDLGSYVAQLPDSLFDTLDGTPQGKLYNPFMDPMQNSGCNSIHTGQVYVGDQPIPEIGMDNLHKCGSNPYKPDSCFSVAADGKSLHARWPTKYNGTVPENVEVTVRSRVFAPHKRGLQYIVVQGFTIEHAANQWIANFWDPNYAHYAQSGAIGTRSGYRWTIQNNTIRKAGTIGLDWGGEGGYPGSAPADNEGTNQPLPDLYGEHTVVHNIFEKNRGSGVQGYMPGKSTFAYNIIQDNGGNGCGGAENAAFKSHNLKGVFEGNVFRRNYGGAPIWFDGNDGPLHFTRNVILTADSNGAMVFELGDGPDLTFADNNIIIGFGSGGVSSQDACGINLAHNLVYDKGTAVTLGGLTGRNSGMYDWWVQANMLLTWGDSPFLHIHKRKQIGGGEAIRNETVQYNLVQGNSNIDYPTDADLDIHVDHNQFATDSGVAIDQDGMTITVTGSAKLDSVGCQVGGLGGDIDFTGAKRSSTKCTPGPFEGLAAGEQRTISLWPTDLSQQMILV